MNKARALFIPAVTAALELTGCAETPTCEPQHPVIVVDIGHAVSGVLGESEFGSENFEGRPVAHREKRVPALTLETIMQNLPDEKLPDLERKIGEYRKVQMRGNLTGNEFVNKCETSDKAVECMKIRWGENARVRQEYPEDFVQCDSILNDDDMWHECVMMRVKADPQALGVMKYCRAQVRDCVENEFRKAR